MINGRTALGLANFSVGLAFLCSITIPLGSLFVQFFLSGPVLWNTTGIAPQLPGVLGNYWIPAIGIYFLLRYLRVHERYAIPIPAHVLVGVGNVLLITYVVLRLAASTIPGGGAGFAVATVGGLLVALPGFLCVLVGILYALWKKTRTAQDRSPDESSALYIGVAEGLGLIAAAGVPVASVLWLYAGAASPFRIAREAERQFSQRCLTAGEFIPKRLEPLRGLYVEKDESFILNGLKEGVYESISFGSLGKGLQSLELIAYYEVRRQTDSRKAEPEGEYLRFLPQGKKPIVVGEISSEHALLWRDIATPAERALKISGNEYALVNRSSGERLATAVFFISGMHRKICGHPEGRTYGVIDFVQRAVASPAVKPASR